MRKTINIVEDRVGLKVIFIRGAKVRRKIAGAARWQRWAEGKQIESSRG